MIDWLIDWKFTRLAKHKKTNLHDSEFAARFKFKIDSESSWLTLRSKPNFSAFVTSATLLAAWVCISGVPNSSVWGSEIPSALAYAKFRSERLISASPFIHSPIFFLLPFSPLPIQSLLSEFQTSSRFSSRVSSYSNFYSTNFLWQNLPAWFAVLY